MKPILVAALGGAVLLSLAAAPGYADPVTCRRTVVQSALGYKRAVLREYGRCLDKDNADRVVGPCPDTSGPGAPPDAADRIARARARAVDRIADQCVFPGDLTANDYPLDCSYEAIATGKEGQCAALSVTSATDFADCLLCWKEAELVQYMGTLYASHAVEVCGSLDASSATCSDFPCTTPLPVQQDIKSGTAGSEYDCQRTIGREGAKYLVMREMKLERCALAGGTRAGCLDGTFDDGHTQDMLARVASRHSSAVTRKCYNRYPVANPPFCCKTGPGNTCSSLPTSRDDCVMNFSGMVQENKVCGVGNTCDPQPGSKPITWWENCPEPNTCGTATPLTQLDDLIDCVATTADLIADELLCLQFRQNGGADWPCPAEGSTTTTTTSSTTSTT